MTTNTLQQDAIEEAYDDLRGMLYKLAMKFSRLLKLPLDDVMSEVNECFVNAYHRHDASRSRFITYVYRHITWVFLERSHRISIKNERLQRKDLELDTRAAKDNGVWYIEFIDRLSEDAKIVAQLVVETPQELARMMKRARPLSRPQSIVRRYLRAIGWARERIAETFEEIADALS